MPASAPWLDTFAPSQWTLGAPVAGGGEVNVGGQSNPSGFDTTLHWKVGGGVILALIIIFGFQAMGFRFVVAANTSVGVGR